MARNTTRSTQSRELETREAEDFEYREPNLLDIPESVTARFEDQGMGNDYNWGCGYPSDKDTQRWMRDNLDPIFGWPVLLG